MFNLGIEKGDSKQDLYQMKKMELKAIMEKDIEVHLNQLYKDYVTYTKRYNIYLAFSTYKFMNTQKAKKTSVKVYDIYHNYRKQIVEYLRHLEYEIDYREYLTLFPDFIDDIETEDDLKSRLLYLSISNHETDEDELELKSIWKPLILNN